MSTEATPANMIAWNSKRLMAEFASLLSTVLMSSCMSSKGIYGWMFSTKQRNRAALKAGGGIVRAPFLARYERSSGPKVEGKGLIKAGRA
jgi:hypothetical protein